MTATDLELIDWPEKALLSKSPRRSALTFPVRMKVKTGDIRSAQPVLVRSVARAGSAAKGKNPLAYAASAGPLVLRDDGETASGEVSLRLDRHMPPGEYVAALEIAGLARKVAFEIAEDTSLRIRPSPVIIDATQAEVTEASVSFENRGNVPLLIDVRGQYPLGREEPLAADVSDTESVLAVLTAALNRAPGLLTEVGTVRIDMPKGPLTVAPGETQIARLSATWEVDLDPVRRYRAFVPVFGSELELAIITASKPEARKPAAPAGGRKRRN
ncbi:MAG: hypothetical protein AAF245_00450 [Pseudomonadota bacterium]